MIAGGLNCFGSIGSGIEFGLNPRKFPFPLVLGDPQIDIGGRVVTTVTLPGSVSDVMPVPGRVATSIQVSGEVVDAVQILGKVVTKVQL